MRNSRPGSNRNWIHSVQNSGGREEEGGGRGWFNLNQSQHLNQIDLDIWNRIEPVGLDAVVVAPLSPSIGDRWCRPMISGHSDYALNMIKASYHRHHHLCVWHLRWIPSLPPPPSLLWYLATPTDGLFDVDSAPIAAIGRGNWVGLDDWVDGEPDQVNEPVGATSNLTANEIQMNNKCHQIMGRWSRMQRCHVRWRWGCMNRPRRQLLCVLTLTF